MSRDSNTRTRENKRFTPSRADAALYNALTTSSRPLAIKELVEATGVAHSTADHTMRFWMQHGLIKRVFLDKCAWHTWAPTAEAKDMADALAAAADVANAIQGHVEVKPLRKQQPKASPVSTDDAAAQALRAIARLLETAAERLERNH